MLQLNLNRFWRRLLTCLLMAWVGLIAPNLAQAERVCDALAHGSVLIHADDHTVEADVDHDRGLAHESDTHHAKHGHCHSPLAHDHADRASTWFGIEHAGQSTLTIAVKSDYRSHIPSLIERPPKA